MIHGWLRRSHWSWTLRGEKQHRSRTANWKEQQILTQESRGGKQSGAGGGPSGPQRMGSGEGGVPIRLREGGLTRAGSAGDGHSAQVHRTSYPNITGRKERSQGRVFVRHRVAGRKHPVQNGPALCSYQGRFSAAERIGAHCAHPPTSEALPRPGLGWFGTFW